MASHYVNTEDPVADDDLHRHTERTRVYSNVLHDWEW